VAKESEGYREYPILLLSEEKVAGFASWQVCAVTADISTVEKRPSAEVDGICIEKRE
jgi:hypothetical protein